jgi:hypothetical protein
MTNICSDVTTLVGQGSRADEPPALCGPHRQGQASAYLYPTTSPHQATFPKAWLRAHQRRWLGHKIRPAGGAGFSMSRSAVRRRRICKTSDVAAAAARGCCLLSLFPSAQSQIPFTRIQAVPIRPVAAQSPAPSISPATACGNAVNRDVLKSGSSTSFSPDSTGPTINSQRLPSGRSNPQSAAFSNLLSRVPFAGGIGPRNTISSLIHCCS